MRKWLAVVIAGALTVSTAALLGPALAADPDPAQVGSFAKPFREDGQPDSPDTAGCKTPGDGNTCLPAAASSVMLPNGKVLYWDALEGTESMKATVLLEGGADFLDELVRVLTLDTVNPPDSKWATTDPARGGANLEGNKESDVGAPADPALNDGGLFCTSHVHLPDGRVLVVGGTDYYSEPKVNDQFGLTELEGLKAARIFNPEDNTWRQVSSMNWGRWYPSAVTLADGDVFVASGVTKLLKPLYLDQKNLPNSGKNVPQTETYDVGANAWKDNGPAGERSLPLYPRIHLLPNGHVYYDAGGQVFNPMGQAYDEATWNIAASYDPGTKSWTDLGIPGMDTGDLTQMGFRGSTFSIMLPLKAPYDSASFLSAGGILAPTPGTVLGTPFSRINTVTVGKDGKESLATTVTDPLSQGRWYSSGVALPDGSVFAVSGASLDEVVGPGDGMPIHQAELFTPDGKGGGSWAPVASESHDRVYHNTAILLPDGRVLVGGHSPIPNNYTKVMTFPGGFSNNSRDASLEVYSPPYMFKGDRPVIGSVKQSLDYGSQLVIPTSDPGSIKSVVLVRNPSLTHLVDADQRTVELPITSAGDGTVTVSLTDNRAVLPAGPYMLFINKGSDKGLIPSVSRQVYVGAPLPKYVAASQGSGSADVLGSRQTRADVAGVSVLPSTGGGTAPALAGVLVLVLAGVAGALRRRVEPAHR
jgi:hypothetical protein